MRNNTRKIDIDDSFGGYNADAFCNVGAAVIGGAVISGAMGSSAARSAASTQADAANNAAAQQLQASREANALQWRMYQQNMANQSPYLQAGGTALAALQSGLGLGGPQARPGSGGIPVAAPSGGSGMLGMPDLSGVINNTVAGGANTTTSGPTNPDGTPAGYNLADYGPSSAATNAAANNFAGKFTETFKPSDLYTDPSYKWRLEQGTQALNSSAAARGMLGSGQNLKDVTNYAQGAASQEYQNAFDRFNVNQTNLYNRISALAGMGQNTAVGMGAQGTAAAAQMGQNTMSGASAAGNYLTSGASASAAGQIGSANAISGAINGGVGNWMGLQYMNKYTGAPTAGATSFAPMEVPSMAPVSYSLTP